MVTLGGTRWSRLRAVGLVLAFAMGWASLAAAAQIPRYDTTVLYVTSASVGSLDPALARTPAERDLVAALFEGLVRATRHGFEPAAARNWTRSRDGHTWTFHLRPGLHFSDGAPVDAKAFADSWLRLRDNPESRRILEGVSVEVRDNLTLVLRPGTSIDDLLDRLALPECVVVRVAGEGSLKGSGAFRLVDIQAGTFTLAPRIDHPEGRPFPARIIVRTGQEALKDSGKADVVESSGSSEVSGAWSNFPVPLHSKLVPVDRKLRVRNTLAGLQSDPVSGVLRFETVWIQSE